VELNTTPSSAGVKESVELSSTPPLGLRGLLYTVNFTFTFTGYATPAWWIG
jgi:hypothetical protein